MTRYEPRPRYPVVAGHVEHGYRALAEEVAARRPAVIAADGPATIDWPTFTTQLALALAGSGHRLRVVDTRRFLAARGEIERRTLAGPLRADPVFAPLFGGHLAELFARLPHAEPAAGETILLVGPGAAFGDHDALWIVDHPKRIAADAVRRGIAAPLGLTPGDADGERRLLYVDWPVLDRHRRSLLSGLDRFVDLSQPSVPRSLAGDGLRASLAELAGGPFRTLPTFAPGPWGGQWLRQTLGIATDGPNLAWSYELIAPESSVVLGDEPAVEVGFELVLAQAGPSLLGAQVERRFDGGFPIRFDYLDTVDGDHLSVHCHPREGYMRDLFGWSYTQHESYYVMASEPESFIFLGLRAGIDEAEFAESAERSRREGVPLEVDRFVQTHPAEQHRLYLIPAGTPHASSRGNVVLEISATPYLYSLRFYDWLREDLDGDLRPVQLEHAFANLETARSGERVRSELLPAPRRLRTGAGFVELDLGGHPELFFAVHRLDLDAGATADDDTAGRFHLLNLVAGEEVAIETAAGRRHELAYAETLVVPASVGAYRVISLTGERCRLVKAFVRLADE